MVIADAPRPPANSFPSLRDVFVDRISRPIVDSTCITLALPRAVLLTVGILPWVPKALRAAARWQHSPVSREPDCWCILIGSGISTGLRWRKIAALEPLASLAAGIFLSFTSFAPSALMANFFFRLREAWAGINDDVACPKEWMVGGRHIGRVVGLLVAARDRSRRIFASEQAGPLPGFGGWRLGRLLGEPAYYRVEVRAAARAKRVSRIDRAAGHQGCTGIGKSRRPPRRPVCGRAGARGLAPSAFSPCAAPGLNW